MRVLPCEKGSFVTTQPSEVASLAMSTTGEIGRESLKCYLLLSELITGKQMRRGKQNTVLLQRGYNEK